MSGKIDIPDESEEKISTGIGTDAHKVLEYLSVKKYGTTSRKSAVLTEAVRFLFAPTPVQKVARDKYADDIEVHPEEFDGDSKTIHWYHPAELSGVVEQYKTTSNKKFIEQAIAEYHAYWETMDNNFRDPVSEDVVDWSAIKDNFTNDFELSEVNGAEIPNTPAYRRPFVYALVQNETGIGGASALKKHYDKIWSDYVEGLPTTRRTINEDFEFLVDNNYLIPAPKDKSDKPQKSPYDERQGDGYYPKRILYNENDERDTSSELDEIIQNTLDFMEQWIRTNEGSDMSTSGAVFTEAENTLTIIASYEVDELQGYADRAEELHNQLIEDVARSAL
ncbi:hypothetical protein G3I44_13650 [Halogeometricum borinquense]|uniref:Uncharacterized protein n=1 Tax=Halogeometricum borinquense TaxID=60847 RepID=A0A6C0UQL6_9EURY|nr:hypothetical protein [Halogeometricum borinquense]QIB75238.1 hypothetical protein G3I44_13650 [Halogeometricum borinquense]